MRKQLHQAEAWVPAQAFVLERRVATSYVMVVFLVWFVRLTLRPLPLDEAVLRPIPQSAAPTGTPPRHP